MDIRCDTDVSGAFLLDPDGERIIFLTTSFVAEDDDGLVITGRLAADGKGAIGLQDIGLRMEQDVPLSPQRLRRVPWSKILDTVLNHGALKAVRTGDRLVVLPDEKKPHGADVRRRRAGGRSKLSDDDYRHVAAIYRRAMNVGEPPVLAVMDEMGCARSTAGGYVTEARRRGFLGPAPAKGAKGEAK